MRRIQCLLLLLLRSSCSSYSSSYFTSSSSLMSSVSRGANTGHTKKCDLLHRPVDQLCKLSGNMSQTGAKTVPKDENSRRGCLLPPRHSGQTEDKLLTLWREQESLCETICTAAECKTGGKFHCEQITARAAAAKRHFTFFTLLFFLEIEIEWLQNVFQGWATSRHNRKNTKK